MAWDFFQRGQSRGVTGDTPFDEMRSALRRIRRAYLERFGRPPTVVELVYVLESCIDTEIEYYDQDTSLQLLDNIAGAIPVSRAGDHIDPGEYEGGLDAESDDFLVFPRGSLGEQRGRESMVLRGQVIEGDGSNVLCRYSILSSSLTDGMARSLIRQCVLQDLLDYDIVAGNKKIRFEPVV